MNYFAKGCTMDNRAIGIFDSGVGGLTCVAPILEALPGERVIYFGDTARTPYGSKSPETVCEFSLQIADFLLQQDIKMLAIACNTISATAMTALKEAHPGLPIIGTIEPAAKRIAGECNEHNSIGIIATKLTTQSGAYEKSIHEINPKLSVCSLACPVLVPLIEEGFTENEVIEPVLRHYMDEFTRSEEIDTLVLGCTHYPIIEGSIRSLYPNIRIINASRSLAEDVVAYLRAHDMTANERPKQSIFYASDLSDNFKNMIELLAPTDKFQTVLRKF